MLCFIIFVTYGIYMTKPNYRSRDLNCSHSNVVRKSMNLEGFSVIEEPENDGQILSSINRVSNWWISSNFIPARKNRRKGTADLLNILYFAHLFDVPSQSDLASMMWRKEYEWSRAQLWHKGICFYCFLF